MDYEEIYRPKQHYITIAERQSRKLYFGNQHLLKILEHQEPHENIFITKYAMDNIVSCIILDFDDKEDSQNALRDARKLQKYTFKQGLNTVIVRSGSKGYHCYIQIPPINFGNDEYCAGVDSNVWFNYFTKLICGEDRNIHYKTLDIGNTSAGLRGNIRVIGSKHPKTNEECRIIKGEFLTDIIPTEYTWDCLQKSYLHAQTYEQEQYQKQLRMIAKREHDGDDPVEQNDLRTLMPSIFGGETKSYKKGYIMMQCPFHNDSRPSMAVDKHKYYCKSCGAKGNWWTLRRLGYVDFKKEKPIRIGKVKA